MFCECIFLKLSHIFILCIPEKSPEFTEEIESQKALFSSVQGLRFLFHLRHFSLSLNFFTPLYFPLSPNRWWCGGGISHYHIRCARRSHLKIQMRRIKVNLTYGYFVVFPLLSFLSKMVISEGIWRSLSKWRWRPPTLSSQRKSKSLFMSFITLSLTSLSTPFHNLSLSLFSLIPP